MAKKGRSQLKLLLGVGVKLSRQIYKQQYTNSFNRWFKVCKTELDTVLNTWEAEEKRSNQVQGHPDLYSEHWPEHWVHSKILSQK